MTLCDYNILKIAPLAIDSVMPEFILYILYAKLIVLAASVALLVNTCVGLIIPISNALLSAHNNVIVIRMII